MQPVMDHETREQMAERVAGMIDHTLLKPTATEEQIRTLCAEALEYRFASVCINPTWVPLCAELLAGSPVKVCTVVGFPLGATLTAVKAYETQQVIAAGAQEVDMVINIGALKSGQDGVVQDDIAAVVDTARRGGRNHEGDHRDHLPDRRREDPGLPAGARRQGQSSSRPPPALGQAAPLSRT